MENVIDNKYRLEQKIGSGGTSVVYRAVRFEDEKVVAVKLLKEEYCDNEEQIQRFLRESNALAHLSHENIVNILDVGQTKQGIYYIVMEYVDRLTLKEYIKARGRLSFDEIIDVVTQICEGLGHAHENGIIHRDIKPQNILLASDGTVKVADFGIARVLNQNTLTMAGKDVVGSVHYISPEQARGSHIDKRSDIYSLGVVMYEMATGELPFEGEEAITVAMKHINQLPKRPIEINPEIPECLNNIILKCMAKDQSKRYQSISELHSDLLDAAENPDGFIVKGNSRGDSALRIGDDEMSNNNSGANKRKGNKKNAKDNKKIRRERNIKLAAMITTLLLVIGGLIWLFVSLFSPGDPPIITSGKTLMPNVVGKMYEDAAKELIERNLRVMSPAYVTDETVPKGQVIRQLSGEDDSELIPGTEIEIRYPVKLIVSNGSLGILMPNICNKTEEEAKETIRIAFNEGNGSYNFDNLQVNYEDNPAYADGFVFRQEPAEAQTVDQNTKIILTVAKAGSSTKSIPNVVGMDEAAARAELREKGFSVSSIKREFSAEQEAGKVFRQTPAAGESYRKDEIVEIEIYVSLGLQEQYTGTVTVPVPSVEQDASLKIQFYDSNQQLIDFDERVLKAGAAAWDFVITGTSYSKEARAYYVYLNDELYAVLYMDFYDKASNKVSPEHPADALPGSTLPLEPTDTSGIVPDQTANP